MKKEIELKGFLDCWVEKPSGLIIPVYRGPNSISGVAGLKEYFATRMTDAVTDHSLDNLFTDDEVQHSDQGGSGTQDSKDGILATDDSSNSYTTITTNETASNTFGQKWKGEIEFSSSLTISGAQLGWNYRGDGVPPPGAHGKFTVRYAGQSFTGVSVEQSDKMIFNWEIYL